MKKFLLTILGFVLMINVVNASEPQKMWEKTWGETSESKETFLALDSYSDIYYAVGITTSNSIDVGNILNDSNKTKSKKNNFDSSNQKFNISFGYGKGIIVKYDKDGNVIWEKKNEDVDAFFQVKATKDSGVLVWGLDLNKVSSTGTSSLLIKYDKDGNMVWQKELKPLYISETPFKTTSINVASNGDIFLMGGYDNRFTLKLDSNGNEIWYKNYNEIINDNDNEYIELLNSFFDKNDNIIVVGYSEIYFVDSNGNETSKYYKKIFKYDSKGNLIFDKKIESSEYVVSCFIAFNQGNDNNYVLLSKNAIYDYVSQKIKEKYLAFEIYDENGNYKETKKISNHSDDDAYYFKLLIDKSDKYIVNYYGNYNMISKIYDKDGNFIWKKTGEFKNGLLDLNIDEYNNYTYVGGVNVESFVSSFENKNLNYPDELKKSYYLVNAYIEKLSFDYKINKETKGEGTIEVNLDNAKAGDEITIEAKAAPGYRVDKIIVTDKDGKVIEVSGNKFVMPESDVTVKVIFTNSPLVNPKTGAISITFAVIAISVYAFFQYKYFKTKEMSL